MLPVASFKLTPILIAAGVVLVRSSVAPIRRVASHPPRFLTLGAAALGTGLVLLLLGCSAPFLRLSGGVRGLVFLGSIFRIDCIPAGLALLVLGALIRRAEQSPQGGVRERARDSGSGHEPLHRPANLRREWSNNLQGRDV